jgi:23S rRNA-intervening sequence protein
MSHRFDHERLNVYHEALVFVGLATDVLERVPKGLAVHNQLDRASTAIPLNIAEGTGKFTAPDRWRVASASCRWDTGWKLVPRSFMRNRPITSPNFLKSK